jgi:hypothetical protein
MRQLGTHVAGAAGSLFGSQPTKTGAFPDAARVTQSDALKARIKSLPPPPPLAAFVQRIERPRAVLAEAQVPTLPALPQLVPTPSSDWTELASHHFGTSLRAPQSQPRAWGSILVLGLGAAGVLGAGFAFGFAKRSEQITTTRLAPVAYVAPEHPAFLASTSRAAQPTRAIDAAQPSRAINAAQPTRAINAAQPTRAINAAQPTRVIPAVRSTGATPTAQPTRSLPAAQPIPATTAAALNAAPASSDVRPQARVAPPPTAASETTDARAQSAARAEHPSAEPAAAVAARANEPYSAPLTTQAALAQASAEPSAALPEQPSRDDIKRTFEALRPALEACTANLHGTMFANVTISGSGRVNYSIIEGAFAGSPEGSCMARALRSASFPHFAATSLTVRFPFVL